MLLCFLKAFLPILCPVDTISQCLRQLYAAPICMFSHQIIQIDAGMNPFGFHKPHLELFRRVQPQGRLARNKNTYLSSDALFAIDNERTHKQLGDIAGQT